MNYSATGEQLTAIADAIRGKTGGESLLAFPDGFTSAIGGITTLAEGTANANATAADIKSGKTAYVNGAKVTGTYEPTATASINVTRTKNLTVTAGKKVSGNPIATFSKPANEAWNTNTMSATITGTVNISGGVRINASSSSIQIVATSTFTMSSSGAVTIQYVAAAVAEISE